MRYYCGIDPSFKRMGLCWWPVDNYGDLQGNLLFDYSSMGTRNFVAKSWGFVRGLRDFKPIEEVVIEAPLPQSYIAGWAWSFFSILLTQVNRPCNALNPAKLKSFVGKRSPSGTFLVNLALDVKKALEVEFEFSNRFSSVDLSRRHKIVHDEAEAFLLLVLWMWKKDKLWPEGKIAIQKLFDTGRLKNTACLKEDDIFDEYQFLD